MTNDPSASTVHLSMWKGDTQLSIGSGVLYERGGRLFIVTAWHNFTGRHHHTLGSISKSLASPDSVVATVSLSMRDVPAEQVPEGFRVRMSFRIPIETEDAALYFVHPVGWPRVDVVALPIDPEAIYLNEMYGPEGRVTRSSPMRTPIFGGGTMDVVPIQDCLGTYARHEDVWDQLIDAGEDLFVLGYPNGITDHTVEPIWKRATVASDPHRGWHRQPQFLIDCASRQGMSGAPVISHSKAGSVRQGSHTFVGSTPSSLLQGIYVGRQVDIETRVEDRLFEAQIGTVWKRQVIDEIIDGKSIALHSSEIGVSGRVLEAAVQMSFPTATGHHEKVLAHDSYRDALVYKVLVELNGNVDPARVVEEVLEHARRMKATSAPEQA